jgi:hypothetical protein
MIAVGLAQEASMDENKSRSVDKEAYLINRKGTHDKVYHIELVCDREAQDGYGIYPVYSVLAHWGRNDGRKLRTTVKYQGTEVWDADASFHKLLEAQTHRRKGYTLLSPENGRDVLNRAIDEAIREERSSV